MFENLVRFVPGQAALFVIGMPAGVVASTLVIANVYGISNHSNLDVKLPGIEMVLGHTAVASSTSRAVRVSA